VLETYTIVPRVEGTSFHFQETAARTRKKKNLTLANSLGSSGNTKATSGYTMAMSGNTKEMLASTRATWASTRVTWESRMAR
jgi:hypothetical protein